MLSVCAECGEPSQGTYCDVHKPAPAPRVRPSRSVGYDTAWDKLSKRARKLQPFCTDCGATEDLTGEHTPRAWDRKNRGLPIRLVDIEVLCRVCNSRRGAARSERPGG